MYIYILYNWNIVASDVKLQYAHSSLIIQVSHECTIIGGMSLSSYWRLILAHFFLTPPPSDSAFFRQSCIPLPCITMYLLIPPWSGAQNIDSPLPLSHTPHLLPIWNHMIFDGADRVRGGSGRGGGKRGGGSRKRGERCKNMGGVEKRKKFARAAPRREEGNKGAGGERPTPCPPPHIWKQAMIHMVLNNPPPHTHTPTHTLSGSRPAVTTLNNV